MTPLRIGQILLALHAAGWRVDVRAPREGVTCVVLTAPVSWEGERYNCRGANLGSALSLAWDFACDTDPGPAQRLAEIEAAS